MRARSIKGSFPRGIVTFLFLVGFVPALFAFDWGGSITTINTSQAVAEGSDDDTFINREKLVMYLTGNIGSTREYVTQLGLLFDSEEPTFAVDIERLFIQNTRTPESESVVRLVTRLGRFNVSDPIGYIVRHPVDGGAIVVSGRRWDLDLSAGTTALVNRSFSNASMSIRDEVDIEDEDEYFGPGRFIGIVRLGLPDIVPTQNVGFSIIAQEDMRDPSSVVQEGDEPTDVDEAGGVLDTQYLLVTIDGTIVGNLFYEVGYALGLGRTLSLIEDEAAVGGEAYRYEQIRSHLVSAGVEYYLTDFLSSVVRAGVTVTTGDDDYSSYTEGNTDGYATMFTPIAGRSAGAVFGLQPGNATIVDLSYVLRPFGGATSSFLSEFQTEASFYSFFRTAGSGPVSVSEVDASTDEVYLGSEVDVALRFRPYSDFGFGLTTGVFVGNESALLDEVDSLDWIVRLQASLSF